MRLLVNFFYAQPVGHAIEALYYANGYRVANPDAEIHVALNSATPVELASLCPWVRGAYPIAHPFLEAASDEAALDGVPREWDWIVDDGRRYQPIQTELFPGMAGYYAASDRVLSAAAGRRPIGYPPPDYARHQQLRLELPASAAPVPDGNPLVAVMPAGSSERALYPSVRSWLVVLDALVEELGPDTRFVLVGRLARDERTATSFSRAELEALLAHDSQPLDAFDLPLVEQLALVQRCAFFLSPHTGFGLAALAVGTPWLTLSGGRWFEYFFNHVPFRSIIPDVERYPSFTQFGEPAVEPGEDGPRTPSMTEHRIRTDLDRIATAARELTSRTLSYEDALADYFRDLLAAHDGDASQIWSIDGVHAEHVAGTPGPSE